MFLTAWRPQPLRSVRRSSHASLILFEPGGSTRAIVDGWFRRAGLAPEPVIELGSIEAIKVLLGSGLSGTVLPALAVAGGVPGATVRRLRPPVARKLALVLRREKVIDRGLRLFLQELDRLRHAGAD